MSWREEKAVISEALAALLPALDHPHLTVPLGFRLAQITGIPEKRCRTVLGWIARDGHPNATRDGGTCKSYGRDLVRWRWHPTPQGRSLTYKDYSEIGLEAMCAAGDRRAALELARRHAKPVVDSTDW